MRAAFDDLFLKQLLLTSSDDHSVRDSKKKRQTLNGDNKVRLRKIIVCGCVENNNIPTVASLYCLSVNQLLISLSRFCLQSGFDQQFSKDGLNLLSVHFSSFVSTFCHNFLRACKENIHRVPRTYITYRSVRIV